MTALFDTNVIIEIEGPNRALPTVVSDLVRISHEVECKIIVHPAQIDDLKHDKDERRRAIQLSRIKQYPMLERPPVPSDNDLSILGWSQNNEHDRIDNLLLFAVKRSAVRFLVTEDRRMHAKARSAGIGERVFFVEDFLSYLRSQAPSVLCPTSCVAVETKYLYELDVTNPFFDSLRHGYAGFDDWYARSAEARRQCWVLQDGSNIRAICIYKEERNEPVTDDGKILSGKVLKLCTFKVADRGRKLGERLLFVAFRAAVQDRFDYVYLHVRDEGQDRLLDLLVDFGFWQFGDYKGDVVYVKDMRRVAIPDEANLADRLAYDISFYPNVVDVASVGKYLVPIRPIFHDRLFPDLNLQQDLFAAYDGLCSEANAIKKAYLCGSRIKAMQMGDLLFFYCSQTRKSVQCFGFVESVLRSRDAEELAAYVSKRTVFTRGEIDEMVRHGEVIAILFRLVKYFKRAVPLNAMVNDRIARRIQSICRVSEDAYGRLFKGLLDE